MCITLLLIKWLKVKTSLMQTKPHNLPLIWSDKYTFITYIDIHHIQILDLNISKTFRNSKHSPAPTLHKMHFKFCETGQKSYL